MMKCRMRVHTSLNNCNGSTNVMIVCVTVVIVLLSALAADIGYAAVERYRLAKNAERVAFTGAERLADGREEAERLMKSYAVKMVSGLTKLDIRISDNNKEMTLHMRKPFKYIFMHLVGAREKQIDTQITVRLSGVRSLGGVRPFAVEKMGFDFGKRYILSNKISEDDDIVELVPLNLGNGSFKANVAYGHMKNVRAGDGVYAYPGEIDSSIESSIRQLISKCDHQPVCTYDYYARNCSKIIIIPVVDKIDFSGKKAMKVLGFTSFFVEEAVTDNGYIHMGGRFVRHTVKSDTSDSIPDFGLVGIKVMK